MRREKPLHLQVADTLRQRIGAGQYDKTGLPPELTLMEEFNVGRHTIRSALQRLVIDGLIERRAGRGTSVSKRGTGGSWVIGTLDNLIEFTADQIQQVEAKLVPAKDFPHVADLFGTSAKGRLFRLLRILSMDGEPCAISSVFTSAANASRVPPDEINHELFINLIEKYCAVRAARVRQVASAMAADSGLADQLEIQVGDPVLILRRTYTSSDGEPIMHVELHCRPDRYHHTVDFIHERKEGGEGDAQDSPVAEAPAETSSPAKPKRGAKRAA
jgi:GntR family transcriptional regulator